MRWYVLAAAAIGLSMTHEASLAQRPPVGDGLSTSRGSQRDAGYFANAGVVRFHLVQGRLCLNPPQHRKGSQSRSDASVFESITVTAERGIPSLHYVYQTDDQHLTLSVQKATHVRIESYHPKSGLRSVLDQPGQGVISWRISKLDQPIVAYEGTTLLHLYALDRQRFEQQYGVLIERMLQGRSLADIEKGTINLLIKNAESSIEFSREDVDALVEQLRSRRHANRMEAENELMKLGSPIVPILNSYRKDDLEPEQKDRIRVILRRLRCQQSDTPASLSYLLVNDLSYWSLVASQLTNGQWLRVETHLKANGFSDWDRRIGEVASVETP